MRTIGKQNAAQGVKRNWMLGLTLAAGLLTAGTAAAHAEPRDMRNFHGGNEVRRDVGGRGFENRGYENRGFENRSYENRGFHERAGADFRYGTPGFRERVDVGYIPPCPGDGYDWTAGYYNDGYWVPGEWVLRAGFGGGYGVGYYGGGYRAGYGYRGGEVRGRDYGYGGNHFAHPEQNHSFDRGFGGGRGEVHRGGRGFRR